MPGTTDSVISDALSTSTPLSHTSHAAAHQACRTHSECPRAFVPAGPGLGCSPTSWPHSQLFIQVSGQTPPPERSPSTVPVTVATFTPWSYFKISPFSDRSFQHQKKKERFKKIIPIWSFPSSGHHMACEPNPAHPLLLYGP